MKTILGKENKNELQRIQKYLLNQMGRLDSDKIMKKEGNKEIQRSGALSQSASSYVKSVQTQMRVLDLSGKYNVDMEDMNKFLNIESK